MDDLCVIVDAGSPQRFHKGRSPRVQDGQEQAPSLHGRAKGQHILDRQDTGNVLLVHADTAVDLIRDAEPSGPGLLIRLFSAAVMELRRDGAGRPPQGQEDRQPQYGRGNMQDSSYPSRHDGGCRADM